MAVLNSSCTIGTAIYRSSSPIRYHHPSPFLVPPLRNDYGFRRYIQSLTRKTRIIGQWAIWLQSAAGDGTILQTGDEKGGRGNYVDEPVYKAQTRSQRLETIIRCGTVSTENHQGAVDTIQAQPVDNVSTTGNCQAWVMETFATLGTNGLFELDPVMHTRPRDETENDRDMSRTVETTREWRD
jgi:hypothetical protein